MWQVIIFCLELFILYLFSRYITIELSRLFLRLFHSHKASALILAFLYLPGTFIHEFAHLFMAVLLRVETTHFTLLPKIGEESIELGSVGIIKPNPIRRLLIGAAPFLFGTMLVLLGIHFFFSLNIQNSLIIAVLVYCLFTVSNTMFSSKRDLEGALELVLAILIVGWLAYFFGLKIPLPIFDLNPLFSLFTSSAKILIIPLGIDLIILVIIKILNSVKIR
jgi:hypothetical protein